MTYYGSDILNYCKLILDFYRIENKNNTMNENIDLTEILKDCPKGWELYSPIFGKVRFFQIDDNCEYKVSVSVINNDGHHHEEFFFKGGLFPFGL